MVKQQLALEQPIVWQTLSHALKNDRLAHAYLFHGAKGTAKVEGAILLAQSLICSHRDEDGFACEKCVQCQRIAKRQYTDLIYLDGAETSIKKENILKLQHEFAKTGLESTGRKIYVINQVENATAEALNALLKFLEEPSGEQMTAILIAEQPDRLLPTIISRCQPIPFRPLSAKQCYERTKNELNPLDAHMLSEMIHRPQEMREASESEEYQQAFAIFREFTPAFLRSAYLGLDVLLRACAERKKSDGKLWMNYFLNMQMTFYRDLIRTETGADAWYQSMLEAYRAKPLPVDRLLAVLSETSDKLTKSVNLTLLCDQMVNQMKEALI